MILFIVAESKWTLPKIVFFPFFSPILRRKTAQEIIGGLAEQAEIEKHVYPHMLRATFATHMIRAGIDARVLQEMLGHEDIKTTLQFYIGVSLAQMRLMHSRFVKAHFI